MPPRCQADNLTNAPVLHGACKDVTKRSEGSLQSLTLVIGLPPSPGLDGVLVGPCLDKEIGAEGHMDIGDLGDSLPAGRAKPRPAVAKVRKIPRQLTVVSAQRVRDLSKYSPRSWVAISQWQH